jgi:predicted GH43/DUF377 family glycosyl hydrolase
MLSRSDRRWVLIWLLSTLAIMAMVAMATGETQTWDTEADFEAGDWDATQWDADEAGVTMTGKASFWKYRGNPVVIEGTSGAWDDEGILEPTMTFAKGQYHLYYTGYDGTDYAIGLARSTDGKSFTKYSTSARVSKGTGGSYDGSGCREPSVIYDNGIFKMWYTGMNGGTASIAYATSPDGLTWTKYGSNPVISKPSSGWGSSEFGDPCVIKVDNKYYMYLSGSATANNKLVGIATSSDGTTWNLYGSNPLVTQAGTGNFGQQEICDVAVVKDGPVFRMYFSGRNTAAEKFKIGYGESFDGYSWVLSKSIYINLGASGAFDDTELMSPGAMMGSDGVIHMAYEGNDATDNELGIATYMPWLLRPNPPSDKLLGTGSTYDATHLQDPSVFKHPSGVYNMYYGSFGGGSYPYSISRATSTGPFSGWSKYASNPVLSRGTSGAWDDDRLSSPCVIFEQGLYKMWFSGYDGSVWKIGYATSTDGNSWTKYGSNPVVSGSSGKWDANGVNDPWVLKVGNTYHMWYVGWITTSGYYVGHATSSDGTTWAKDTANPVFGPEPDNSWEQYYISNPCVTREDGRYVMYYAGTYTTNKQRIGIAYSSDGITWTRDPRNPYMDWGNATQFSDDGLSMGSVMIEGGYNHIFYAGYSSTNWEIGYATFTTKKATYTTPVLDAAGMWPVGWGSISWEGDLPLGTYLKFQVATNQGGSIWRFVGPDGTAGTYFTEPGQTIFWSQSGKFMRVRAYLETDDLSTFIPVLRSVTVTYGPRAGVSPPTVTLTSPNGGEDWMKTKAYPITWEAVGNLGDTSVLLEYSTDNGTAWTNVAANQPNTGFYKWTVPSTETSGALIKVTITDIDNMVASDTSDATFAIDPPGPKAGAFHFPAEGTKLVPGPVPLSWTVEDPWGLAESPLTLDITTDGGLTWSSLAEGMPFTDGIHWDVPQLTTSSDVCRLRLSVLSWLGDVSVIESSEFSIDVQPPSVTVQPPPNGIVEGIAVTIDAEIEEDLGPVSVVLHVRTSHGDRTYAMSSDDGASWTASYLPEMGDVEAWVTVDDGTYLVNSDVHTIEVERASATGGAATSSMVGELMVATVLAIALTVGIIGVVLLRRK